ncbi:MAG TPA: threonine--tRNA ligase [Niallia sp.]|nr:threonine--tRNA ligase [Niallia sp.]
MNASLIKVKLPDGKIKEFPKGIKMVSIAEAISPSLRKKAVGGRLTNQVNVDISYVMERDGELEIITLESIEGRNIMRHSAAHVLAQAIKRLYPNVQLGIGPVIEDGFYYDVKLEHSLTSNDLQSIEKEMKKIIKENHHFIRSEVSYEKAKELFQSKGEDLKLEILKEIPKEEAISLYSQGEFIDLCRGTHVPSTGFIKAVKLTRVSGAYWKGDSQNEVLQRIYGVAFPNQKELEEYLFMMEEASKRDHRKLGKQLDLFMFSEEAPGMPFYLPKGQIIRNELEKFSRELQGEADYEEVRTPFMMNERLWKQSGHWDHYHENMYFSEVDKQRFALKPMNCPGHMLVFKNNLYSYRDLPIRISEFGQVHRHEYSGALNGMFRVRTFCQDDAHIFVRQDQMEEEIKSIFQLIDKVYSTFGFSYSVELSTRPEDSLEGDELWEMAEGALENVLHQLKIDYVLNEGDGAFYGPKIDFHIKDALKRSHQCATIQLDFQMPKLFDLAYINEKNEKVCPVVIHRAMFGSIDRFFGILIEHFAGALPVWLSPVQVQIVPVSTIHLDYCFQVQAALKKIGVRVQVDSSEEKLGYKIRNSQMKKIPYTFVLGDKERETSSVQVRKYGEKESNHYSFEAFQQKIKKQIKERSL